jgi:mono/diheme cytochrome c family protein
LSPCHLVTLSPCLLVCLLAGCQQEMAQQPSYRPLQPSAFFPDGRSARPLVPGTVPRGEPRADPALYAGRDEKGKPVEEFPFAMTKDVLRRGQERFNIFCAPCHNVDGRGEGRIVQRGFTRPPDFVTDLSRYYRLRGEKVLLRDAPVGHFFDVVTNGFGAMPDYSEQVPVRDRWAIIGYVRVLQYSQSPEMRAKLGKGDKK